MLDCTQFREESFKGGKIHFLLKKTKKSDHFRFPEKV